MNDVSNRRAEPGIGATLDPADWEEFRRLAHASLDECIEYLATVRARPVWQPVPERTRALLRETVPGQGLALDRLLEDFHEHLLPYATGNVHPRFFGWVHGAGTPVGMLAEMLAAAMNANCGGRDHAAIYVERQVIEWVREIFGFPVGSSGVLTVGTSMATVICLAAARCRRLGPEVRVQGNGDACRLAGYASAQGHVALRKAFELLGLGSERLRRIATDGQGRMSLAALSAAVAADRAAGLEPFVVIGTAGTVNTGACDDLEALARYASGEGLWLHVDGAFGAWARIAGEPWRRLVQGIERADSLAFDFHKWISVPYDAGCALLRDEQAHRAAFAERPDYLAGTARGLAAGDPWPCDYGIDLSRGFRALKVWMTLRHYGLEQLGRAIARNCRTAGHLARRIEQSVHFELAAPVALNICCFRPRLAGLAQETDRIVTRLVEELQLSGIAAPSTARVGDRLCVRVAVLNHRTEERDVEMLLQAAEEILAKTG